MFKRSISVLVSFCISLSPILFINSANASTVGDWTLGNPVSQGAKTIYEGTKNALINGKNYVKKSTAIIAPATADVTKVIARGGVAYAVTFAIEQLFDAVDWVLDPANNSIIVHPRSVPAQQNPSYQYIYRVGSNSFFGDKTRAAQEACSTGRFQGATGWTFAGTYDSLSTEWIIYPRCTKSGYSAQYATFSKLANSAYNPSDTSQDTKVVPIPTVANKIISNAEADHAVSQTATREVARDIVQDAENDKVKARPIVTQLEANAETVAEEATATGTTTPNSTTGGNDLALEFPTFCGWAPMVCEAAQTVISFPATVGAWWETSTNAISEAWTFVKDWVKPGEVIETDTSVQIEQPLQEIPQTNYFQWNAYCPFESRTQLIEINGETSSIDSDFSSWCSMASEIKPLVLLAGAIISLLIVSGVGVGRGDD